MSVSLTRFFFGACLVVLLVVVPVRPSSGEGYADLYAGGAFTSNTNVEQISSLGVTINFADVEFNKSLVAGGRVGYWFDQLPYLGVGLDAFWFQPSLDRQTVPFTSSVGLSGTATLSEVTLRTVGLGFDLLRLRAPLLVSEQFPHGKLQPYLSAGPAIFYSIIKATSNFIPNNQRQTDTSLGIKVGIGANFQVSEQAGLFAEYRFTHFKADASFTSMGPPSSLETVKATFNTHHLIVGLSFRFD